MSGIGNGLCISKALAPSRRNAAVLVRRVSRRRSKNRSQILVVIVVVVVVAAVIVPPGMISNALGEQRVLHCSVLPQHHFLLEPRRSQAPRSPVARVCIWMHE